MMMSARLFRDCNDIYNVLVAFEATLLKFIFGPTCSSTNGECIYCMRFSHHLNLFFKKGPLRIYC